MPHIKLMVYAWFFFSHYSCIWAVSTKAVMRLACNKVHPFTKSGMKCDIGFVFFDLVITMDPHFAKKTNLVYHHILIYLEAKWQTYAFFRVFSYNSLSSRLFIFLQGIDAFEFLSLVNVTSM